MWYYGILIYQLLILCSTWSSTLRDYNFVQNQVPYSFQGLDRVSWVSARHTVVCQM